MRTITRDEAARFLLHHQGLLGERRFQGAQGAMDFTAQAGCVQYDPVDICGRSPELTYLSRVEGFEPDILNDLLYRRRDLIDHFDKNLAIFPKEDWPRLRRLRLAWANTNKARQVDNDTREHVLAHIREHGPQDASGLGLEGKVDWHWAATSLSRAALEQLYNEGLLLIHSKKGVLKTYDLAENCLDAGILGASAPFEDEAAQTAWHALRRVRAVGLLWNRASDAWLGTAAWYAPARQQAFERLLKTGELLPIKVEGLKDTLYLAAADEAALEAALALAESPPRSELLAPLDSFLWDRRLIKALFDFSYTWEIYTPPAKRVYGPYVLPILMDGRLVGRAEPVLERKANSLHLRGLWWEEGVKPDKARRRALDGALSRLARYHGARYAG